MFWVTPLKSFCSYCGFIHPIKLQWWHLVRVCLAHFFFYAVLWLLWLNKVRIFNYDCRDSTQSQSSQYNESIKLKVTFYPASQSTPSPFWTSTLSVGSWTLSSEYECGPPGNQTILNIESVIYSALVLELITSANEVGWRSCCHPSVCVFICFHDILEIYKWLWLKSGQIALGPGISWVNFDGDPLLGFPPIKDFSFYLLPLLHSHAGWKVRHFPVSYSTVLYSHTILLENKIQRLV